MTKTLSKLGMEGNRHNLRKVIYENPIVCITLKGEYIPPKIRNKGSNLLSLLLLSTVIEVLASAVRQEKETKGIEI